MKEQQVFKPNKKRKHTYFTKGERENWMNLNVNIDSYADHWEIFRPEFEELMEKFSTSYQKKICEIYGLTKENINQSWLEVLLQNVKSCIDIFCVWKFISVNPLCYSRFFGVPMIKGKPDIDALVTKAIVTHNQSDLRTAFIVLQLQKSGHARYSYDLSETSGLTYEGAKKIIRSLISFLKKREGKKYYLRFNDKIENAYHFLLLKENNDRVFPAIPQNLRVISGKYFLISIHIDTKKLEVHSQVGREAGRVRFYIEKKTKIKVRSLRSTEEYNPEAFFNTLLDSNQQIELTLHNAKIIKQNTGDSIFDIKDIHKKNDIIGTLKRLKHDGYLTMKDFSEFGNFIFGYRGLRYQVNVVSDRWGQIKLELLDRNKPAIELAEFSQVFENTFEIYLGKFLKNQIASMNKATIIQKILDKPTLEAVLPNDVSDILIELVSAKVINQPSTSIKRRCINCYKIYWTKGNCPECGSDYYYEGDYIDISLKAEPVLNLLKKYLELNTNLKVKRVVRQIESSKFNLLELLDSGGKSLSIFASKSIVPQKILSDFSKTGNPLLVVILAYVPNIRNQVTGLGFECMDFATCYATIDTSELKNAVLAAMQNQNNSWRVKMLKKGYQSYQEFKARNEKNYTDQQFEKDIYNMLHEIFFIGDRLGGKFTGVAAPDGIVALQNYAEKPLRYCMAWDCKFSTSKGGYRLADKAQKHRKYIKDLKINDKVTFYGGLKTYLIISQHMNMNSYEKFYTKVLNKFIWTGKMVFIHSDTILKIYESYRRNSALIASFPYVFYSRIYALFRNPIMGPGKVYYEITSQIVQKMLEEVENEFKILNKSFEFDRSEFI